MTPSRRLAALQSDAPPMAPDAAARSSTRRARHAARAGVPRLADMPVAAASIGQVHRAVTRDGRRVAVKVQYPGVDAAIESDLDNAEALYRLFSAFALKGLDAKALVDELRDRMRDELDYPIEARQPDRVRRTTSPAIRSSVSRPSIRPRARRRVLTTEWVDGIGFDEFRAAADEAARQRAGETIWRFAQHSVHRIGAFNGDPHPGQLPLRCGRRRHVPRLRAGQAVVPGRVAPAGAEPRRDRRAPRSRGAGAWRWRTSASCDPATG